MVEFQNVNLTEVEIDGVEFRLESRLGDNVLLRAAYAHIDGHDTTGEIDVPLASIAPNEGVVGLRYLADSASWGLDGSIRIVDDREPEKVPEGEHIPDGYQVVDVVAFFALPADMKLRVGVLNATDEGYFESWHVRGRQANDPRLMLYSSPRSQCRRFADLQLVGAAGRPDRERRAGGSPAAPGRRLAATVVRADEERPDNGDAAHAAADGCGGRCGSVAARRRLPRARYPAVWSGRTVTARRGDGRSPPCA